MKKLKTGAEYRHDIKKRVQAYRQKMRDAGYKNITVFISGDFHKELERMKIEEGLTRDAAIEAIFQGYLKNRNVTSNVPVKEPTVKTSDVASNVTVKDSDLKPDPGKPIAEPPEDIPDREQQSEQYKIYLYKILLPLKAKGKTLQQIADYLNEQKIEKIKGGLGWKTGAVDTQLRTARKWENTGEKTAP